MSVEIPSPAISFDSACPTPYITAPPSPKRLDEFYYSAPPSPTRVSATYHEYSLISTSESSSAIPFDWEEKPGKPKSTLEDDFAFDFGSQSERYSVSAEELFDAGKIRPLKPPPRLQLNESGTRKSFASSQGKNMFRNAFSSRQSKDLDPFVTAIEKTRRDAVAHSHRRSISSFRVSEPSSPMSSSSSSSSFKGYRKRRWKDLLLFRSSVDEDDTKNASFRWTSSSGSMIRGPVSDQERQYPVNRAGTEELKRPYKRGLLGCLGFNQTVHGLLGKGLESL